MYAGETKSGLPLFSHFKIIYWQGRGDARGKVWPAIAGKKSYRRSDYG